ncbi:MAG: hypothetical protein WD049_05350 [Candidatus Paceibacterota bacterium]
MRTYVVCFYGAVIVTMIVTALLAGCGQQVDFSAGVGWKSLYPDDIGPHKLTDPRRGMYEGSGYGERHTAGSEGGFRFGFRRMEVPYGE